MNRKTSWHGVKTLYRAEPLGRPQGTDRLYSRDVTLVEERIVVIRARNGSDAIRKAEVEAKKYARTRHRNPYGQRVRLRFLGCLDAYDMNEPLVEGAEVFSTTLIVSRRVSDHAIVDRLMGARESQRKRALRRNILDICFSGAAPGVKLTRREAAYRQEFVRRLGRRNA